MSTRTTQRRSRAVGVLALALPITGLLLSATAAPALASTTYKVVLNPSSAQGAVYTPSNPVPTGGVKATGTITTTSSTSGDKLYLTGATASDPTLYSSNTGTGSCTAPILGSCTATATATFAATELTSRNAHWTAALGSPSQASQDFYTNYPPTADAANLSAAANGQTEVDLSWTYSGTEADRAGFEITETQGGTSRTIDVTDASMTTCSNCSYAITGYTAPAAGTTVSYSYTVTALRTSGGCGSCGTYTRSNPSASAGAQLVGPPAPTPTPSGSPAPSASPGSAGSGGTTGGSSATGTSTGTSGTGSKSSGSTTKSGFPALPPLAAQRRAFALSFNHFAPSLGIPKLPPLPATVFPMSAQSDNAGIAGGYQPVLPYAAKAQKPTTSVFSSPLAAVTSLDTAALARSLAVALILLVAAAHVRFFLRRTSQD